MTMTIEKCFARLMLRLELTAAAAAAIQNSGCCDQREIDALEANTAFALCDARSLLALIEECQ